MTSPHKSELHPFGGLGEGLLIRMQIQVRSICERWLPLRTRLPNSSGDRSRGLSAGWKSKDKDGARPLRRWRSCAAVCCRINVIASRQVESPVRADCL
jgi:hypothetical protein